MKKVLLQMLTEYEGRTQESLEAGCLHRSELIIGWMVLHLQKELNKGKALKLAHQIETVRQLLIDLLVLEEENSKISE